MGALKAFIIAACPHGDNQSAIKRQDSVTKEIHVNSCWGKKKKAVSSSVFQFLTVFDCGKWHQFI